LAILVTVAIPVLDGGVELGETLQAVAAQRIDGEVELLVADSGSRDGSRAVARAHGAAVIEIPRERFSHGGTRNLLMERSRGAHVAFLTQDATPADDRWLERLLSAFGLAPDVGLAFGRYRPRPGASPMVARELTSWFTSLSPSGAPRIDRLAPTERAAPARTFLGPLGFFTDANGCVARVAWERVPFRNVSYAEDHLLAQDMLRSGFAKVYSPEAAVWHSHDYSGWQWLRRSFDEARAMTEVYDRAEPLEARRAALNVWGRVGADWRWFRAGGGGHGPADVSRPLAPIAAARLLTSSAAHHTARAAGELLGTRADGLPERLVRRLSLERRAT
jgi:rhamnosyltransferase